MNVEKALKIDAVNSAPGTKAPLYKLEDLIFREWDYSAYLN